MTGATPSVEVDHAALIRPFLINRWRSRYDSIAPRSRRRAELYGKLCHGYEQVLDWRNARPTAAISLVSELRQSGATDTCYCFCAPPELDGRVLPLIEAIAVLYGHGLPVLLVCKPGSLGYFEPEYVSGAGLRFVLQRSAEPVAGAIRRI
ncbi:MAG: hypothetical protein ACRELF_09725 [Gemmataceae bacterium]